MNYASQLHKNDETSTEGDSPSHVQNRLDKVVLPFWNSYNRHSSSYRLDFSTTNSTFILQITEQRKLREFEQIRAHSVTINTTDQNRIQTKNGKKKQYCKLNQHGGIYVTQLLSIDIYYYVSVSLSLTVL